MAAMLLMSLPLLAGKPWTKGGFETKKYRNLFVEMGYSQKDVDAKVKQVFNDVFRGPNKVYFEVGDSMGYVSDIKNHDARTEGMSYGMMIAVQMNEKDIFSHGAAEPTAPAIPMVPPAMASSISSPRCSSPPTAGVTIRALTTRLRLNAS